jgi:hypothetical protein
MSMAVLCACALYGCGELPKVGAEQPSVGSVDELARRVTERVSGVTSFLEKDAGAKFNMIPAKAVIAIHAKKGLNLKVKHPLTGSDVAKLILNEVEDDDDEGRFAIINYDKAKAHVGNTEAVLTKYLPKIGLSPEDVHPLRLFFPSFDVREGETSSFFDEGSTYTAELWHPQTGPRLQVVVDSWSLVPLSATLYNDGTILAHFYWSDLVELKDKKIVMARTLRIELPKLGRTIRLTSHKPMINPRLSDRAFELRIPPGVEEEEIDADSGS